MERGFPSAEGLAGVTALVVLLIACLALPARGQSLAVPPGDSVAAEMQDFDDVPEAAPRAAVTEFPLPTREPDPPKPASEPAKGAVEPSTSK